MRMPLLALGLTVVVCISSLCPVLTRRVGRRQQRSCRGQANWSQCCEGVGANAYVPATPGRGGGESFQYRRKGRKALRLLRQWMLAG